MTAAPPVPEIAGGSFGREVSWRGVRTMAGHEFRLRLRACRWRWLLAAWFGALLLFTWGVRAALGAATRAGDRTEPNQLGVEMFGALMLFMLALAMLVVPALAAQSINGDRERGVLATLQTTLLTPAEIALGKLVAAWGTALVFLAVSIPMVVWCLLEGGVSVGRAGVTLLVMALLLGGITAIAQSLSALVARGTTSAVLSYLLVFTLSVVTVVAFGIGTALTTTYETATERVPVWDGGQPRFNEQTGVPLDVDRWETRTFRVPVPHPERVWWLLVPNPFAVLADSTSGDAQGSSFDLLREIRAGVRSAREPGEAPFGASPEPGSADKPLWPFGFAFYLILGVGALTLTTRRLRTPYARLPRGVRVG